MDDDDKLKLTLSAVVIASIAKRRRKRRQAVRACWARPWICDRPRFGGYEALLKDRMTDSKAYNNFCCMSPADYQELLNLVTPLVSYLDTRLRKAISADEIWQ